MSDRGQQYTHARFWKCALQVNTHGYSKKYRGQDNGLTARAYAEELLGLCKQEQIELVGLADHGSVQDVDLIRDVLSPQGVVVFPGFEISSTEKIQMVCLFAEETTTEELQRILGRLDLTDPEEHVAPSNLGCLEIGRTIAGLGGFWYAAHMTGNNGLLRLQKDGGGLVHVWKNHELVQVGQIPGPVDSLPEKYKPIVLNQNPHYRRECPITVINAKDVDRPATLTNPRASTFIKMTRPCFSSFLMAFKDPESRVRLVDQMQEQFYSRIDCIQIEGGYFGGLSATFSGHLDAVIGGRGTGKSTLLECLRYALEIPHKAEDAKKQGDQIVEENLGKEGGRVIVDLRSAVNNMKPYRVIRRYGEPARVIDEDGNESSLRPAIDLLPSAEIYGQSEIYELARSEDALARVLDRFLPHDATQQSRLESARRKLVENGTRLAKAQGQKDSIETRVAELPKLLERVKQFQEQGLEEKLKVVPLLERERQLEPRVRQEVERVREAQQRFEEELPDLVFLSDRALSGLPHAELLQRGRELLERLEVVLRQKLHEIESAITDAEKGILSLVEQLEQEMNASAEQLEKEFACLPAMPGKTGPEVGIAYQRLLREIEEIKPIRSNLKTVDDLVSDLEQTRRNLLGEISDIRTERTIAKQVQVENLNRRLTGKLRISIIPNGLRTPLRDFLQGLPGVGSQKTKWIDDAQGLTVLGLVAAIREGKEALLGNGWGLTPGFAETLTKLGASQLHVLEAIDLEDRVSIELNVSHSGPERFRTLENLSIGQQCTAILHLLLLSNMDPLIMDQPEDNLDNAFIAERIVKELRTTKTQRQFLFATHNANIPVFGDAEWIGVCTATGDRAEMPPHMQGSIDIAEIRDHAADILEGGKEAFTQRKAKYGY